MVLPSSAASFLTNPLLSISVFSLVHFVSGHLAAAAMISVQDGQPILGLTRMSKLADPPIFLTLLMDV